MLLDPAMKILVFPESHSSSTLLRDEYELGKRFPAKEDLPFVIPSIGILIKYFSSVSTQRSKQCEGLRYKGKMNVEKQFENRGDFSAQHTVAVHLEMVLNMDQEVETVYI